MPWSQFSSSSKAMRGSLELCGNLYLYLLDFSITCFTAKHPDRQTEIK